MPFNLEKFNNAQFIARTEEIRCDELVDFFEDKEEPIFKIRGLTAVEYAKAELMVGAAQKIEQIVTELVSDDIGKISQFPLKFYHMTNRILSLTNSGQTLKKKLKSTGEIQKSEKP